MATIKEGKVRIGDEETPYVEVRFAAYTFVVFADGSAYRDGYPLYIDDAPYEEK